MARSIPPERLRSVIDAAVQVFVTHGFRRAQMQDVADVLGLAKGTLYGYAASKDALFAAAVRYGDSLEPLPALSELPLPAASEGELAGLVSSRLAAELSDLALTRALQRASLPSSPEEASAELASIVTDLFHRLARHRVAIKLVDRCAPELPALARVWFDTGRSTQMSAMQGYLDSRQSAGLLTMPGPTPIVARTIVELCVLWAVHCQFDPAPAARPQPSQDSLAATTAALIARSTALDERYPS
jgi:AcrR family transcriptional regulator